MTTHATHTNSRSENRAGLLRLAARMAEEMELIGGRMKERREELRLKQREVADRIPGKTESKDVSRWENGRHRPNPDTLDLIAKALETTVADLYAGPLSQRCSTKSDLMDSLQTAEGVASPGHVEEAIEALRAEMSEGLDLLHAEIKDLRKQLGIASRKRKGTRS